MKPYPGNNYHCVYRSGDGVLAWMRHVVRKILGGWHVVYSVKDESLVLGGRNGISVCVNDRELAFLFWIDIDLQYATKGYITIPPLPRKAEVMLADFFQRERRWERVKRPPE